MSNYITLTHPKTNKTHKRLLLLRKRLIWNHRMITSCLSLVKKVDCNSLSGITNKLYVTAHMTNKFIMFTLIQSEAGLSLSLHIHNFSLYISYTVYVKCRLGMWRVRIKWNTLLSFTTSDNHVSFCRTCKRTNCLEHSTTHEYQCNLQKLKRQWRW